MPILPELAAHVRFRAHCESWRQRRDAERFLSRAEGISNLLTISECSNCPTASLYMNAKPVQIVEKVVNPLGNFLIAGANSDRGRPNAQESFEDVTASIGIPYALVDKFGEQ